MENLKKNTEKKSDGKQKTKKVVFEPEDKEAEIKKALEHFEIERRKQFEEMLIEQKKTVESEMRGELREYRLSGNYLISFVVFSSRIKDQPIWGVAFETDSSFSEEKIKIFF